MVKPRNDLTGRKFSHWTVLSQCEDYVAKSGVHHAQYLCECDCPDHTRAKIIGTTLLQGRSKSCGCAKKSHLIGKKFGHLTVIAQAPDYVKPSGAKESAWVCECDCPNHTRLTVIGSNLTTGHTTSCGCAQIAATSQANRTHGMSDTRIYNIYMHMIGRCYNPTNNAYKDYGGRGIYICDEWRGPNGFVTFRDWSMNNGYSDDLSIDRIDNNGPYAPWNCRWANGYTQNNNTRANIHANINGDGMTLSQCSNALGIDYERLRHMVYTGKDIHEAIDTIQQDTPINAVYFVDEYGNPSR